jgi:nucleotide-binding universal stress UspA family protein/transcription elongation GreA/GreB family factor
MTTADATVRVAPRAADALRARVRALLEAEYLRLHCVDRLALSAMAYATAEDGVDPEAVAEEAETLDRRIALIHDQLAALSAPGTEAGRVLLLDCGDGPRLMLVSAAHLLDDHVIAADSPLGVALRGVQAGQVVDYRAPGGLRHARVLAVEESTSAPDWHGLTPPEVLVGFDGSPSSRSALAWAAREAALRARPLRLLHAREDGVPAAPDGLLTEGLLLAAKALKADRIRASAMAGDAAARLAERAAAAELVVVGRGGPSDDGLGPVANEVLEGASRATVVVPPGPVPNQRGRVVVGLRRSHDAADALAVGFAEAHRRGTELAVTVIHDDVADGPAGDGLVPRFHAPDAADAVTSKDLLSAVAQARHAFPDVPVTTTLRTGHFSDVLIELSHSADLIVLGLGERPTGVGHSDLLVASHADCPVIVIRETSTGGEF